MVTYYEILSLLSRQTRLVYLITVFLDGREREREKGVPINYIKLSRGRKSRNFMIPYVKKYVRKLTAFLKLFLITFLKYHN